MRSGAADAVRVVGVVAVVIGHVWPNETTRLWLYSWHVPLFFVLSGYFWTKGRSVAIEVKRRAQSLVRPYIFWFVFLLAIISVRDFATSSFSVKRVASAVYGGYFATTPFSAFWFVTVLFFACVLLRFLERFPTWAICCIAALGLGMGYIIGEWLAKTPLSLGSAWPCMALILAGTALRRLEPLLRYSFWVGLGLLSSSAILLMTVPGLASLDIKGGEYGVPVLSILVAVLVVAGLLLVMKSTFAVLPRGFDLVSTGLARAGFAVVLSHALVLYMLGTTASGGLLDFALATILPWTVGLLALRTGMSPWMTGVASSGQRVAAGDAAR